MLKILQINLQHCKLASSNLVSILAKEDFSIVLIQEPWLGGDGKICGLKAGGFTLCHSNYSSEARIRACILVKNNLHFLFSQELSDPDTTTIAIKQGTDTI
ncbi:hypothetical protein, partial [Streptomyces sp. IBSBF 2390]|uniref:hypothetical protein n=1 Tax=Streptomyces sp. IBSBF 2390 TaxID=2903533 RepID=UPI002FDC55CB